MSTTIAKRGEFDGEKGAATGCLFVVDPFYQTPMILASYNLGFFVFKVKSNERQSQHTLTLRQNRSSQLSPSHELLPR